MKNVARWVIDMSIRKRLGGSSSAIVNSLYEADGTFKMTVGKKYVGGSYNSDSIGFWKAQANGSITRDGEILGRISINYCHAGATTRSLQIRINQAEPKVDLSKYNCYVTIGSKRGLIDTLNDRSGNDSFYWESRNDRTWADHLNPLVGQTVDCKLEFILK